MKLAVMIVLLLMTTLLPASLLGVAPRATIAQVSTYTHTIYESTITDSHKCSATAIGPHALLTAAHCELGVDDIAVDNPDHAIKIVRVVRDGADHTIYYLDTTFATFAPINTATPGIGDDVFMIAGPAEFTNVFRRGYVAKVVVDMFDNQVLLLYDLNGFHGDSGAGLFNDNGELTGVLTAGLVLDKTSEKTTDEMSAKFMTGLALRFTPAQLLEASGK